MRLNRRQILQASLVGGLAGTFTTLGPLSRLVGAASPAALPVTPAVVGSGTLDAYEILHRAVRFGRRIGFGGRAAYAAADSETAVVTIKVLNHIHTPLCFALGALNAAGDDLVPYTGPSTAPDGAPINVPWSDKVGAATLGLLLARGVDKPTNIARFQQLRMNKWFASILNTGMDETNAVPDVLSSTDIAPFPGEDDVAIQAALGVSQTDLTLNHSFQNCSLPTSTDTNRGGDLGYHLTQQNLIQSPLGLVCFNIGITETTDSIGNVPNRVVGNDLKKVVALGRSVDSYITVLRQAVGLGLVDDALAAQFDALVGADSSLASQLTKNRITLEKSLTALGTAATVETSRHMMTGVVGAANVQQSDAADQTATGAFLAQCKFVQRALDVPGKPFRNFNLYLHCMDLDGRPLDVAPRGTDGGASAEKPYSYVEGMRQLAIGLNMLAQVIKKHRNVYVVVVSEGGRDARRGDNKVSHSLVMGPGGAGRLKDYLYVNRAAVNSTDDPFRIDPNRGDPALTGTGQRTPSDNVVLSEAGTPINEQMTVGAILNGLVRHFEQIQAGPKTTTGLGKYVAIQTK